MASTNYYYYYSEHMPNQSMVNVTMANKVVGAAYIGVPLFCLVPYLACLWAIFSDRNLRRQPTYIIIYHIGIADVLQLVTDGVISGIFTLTGSTLNYTLNKTVGAFLNIGWIVYTVLAHVLAFNRYVWICRPEWRDRIFSPKKTERIMYACWTYGLFWFFCYFSPNIDMVFNVHERSWNYFTLKRDSYICWMLELIQDSFQCAGSIVWYALSFWKIHTQVALISAEEIREHKNEVRLLIQAFLICVMIFLTLVGFFLIPQFPDQLSWTGPIANFIWLLCCANNCFVYLMFNRMLRDRVFSMFRHVKSKLLEQLPCKQRHPHRLPQDVELATELCSTHDQNRRSSDSEGKRLAVGPTTDLCTEVHEIIDHSWNELVLKHGDDEREFTIWTRRRRDQSITSL